jgi:hypothetical protein
MPTKQLGAGHLVTSASLMIPDTFVPSGRTEHAPFAFWIVEALRPRLLVELGVHLGISYLSFCQAVKRAALETRCIAINLRQSDTRGGSYGTEVLQRLRDYHDEKYITFSHLIQSSFDEASFNFDDQTIDLLHIDGFHTYQALKHDFMTWKPRLSKRGVILFHGTNNHVNNSGVCKLWNELQAQSPSFEFTHGSWRSWRW